jgi:hypothetical protein
LLLAFAIFIIPFLFPTTPIPASMPMCPQLANSNTPQTFRAGCKQRWP